MQTPPRPRARENSEAMVRNIGRELAEIDQRIRRYRGDRVAAPRLTGTCRSRRLVSSVELLQNPLIDSAGRPRLALQHQMATRPGEAPSLEAGTAASPTSRTRAAAGPASTA